MAVFFSGPVQQPFKKDLGFTLIELVVVISLISLLLFFSVPRLDISLFSDDQRKLSAWLQLTVKSLKQEAVRKQTGLVLNLDMDENEMWTSTQEEVRATGENEDTPKGNVYRVPEGVHLTGVEFTDQDKITSGIARINFYPKGYSDRATILLEDDQDRRLAYHVEPFLLRVDVDIDEP